MKLIFLGYDKTTPKQLHFIKQHCAPCTKAKRIPATKKTSERNSEITGTAGGAAPKTGSPRWPSEKGESRRALCLSLRQEPDCPPQTLT